MDKKKQETVKSSQLRCGRRTYFFDVKKASNNSKYLKVTETQMPKEEGGEIKRNSFLLFATDAQNFHRTLGELMGDLG